MSSGCVDGSGNGKDNLPRNAKVSSIHFFAASSTLKGSKFPAELQGGGAHHFVGGGQHCAKHGSNEETQAGGSLCQ